MWTAAIQYRANLHLFPAFIFYRQWHWYYWWMSSYWGGFLPFCSFCGNLHLVILDSSLVMIVWGVGWLFPMCAHILWEHSSHYRYSHFGVSFGGVNPLVISEKTPPILEYHCGGLNLLVISEKTPLIFEYHLGTSLNLSAIFERAPLIFSFNFWWFILMCEVLLLCQTYNSWLNGRTSFI